MSKKINQQFACSKMMLPEHRGSLQEQSTEKKRADESSRPELDEQERERLQQIFEQAFTGRRVLRVTVFTGTGREVFTGIPLRVDPAGSNIIFSSGTVRGRRVRAADILHLEPADPR